MDTPSYTGDNNVLLLVIILATWVWIRTFFKCFGLAGVVCCGTNYCLSLVNVIYIGLQHLFKISLPQLIVFFSEIIQRLWWLDSVVLKSFEKVRKRVNRAVEKLMAPVFCFSYCNVNLEGVYQGSIGKVGYNYPILVWT